MAAGYYSMNTYVAKKIVGSDVSQNPEGALLQSGAGRANTSPTGDTWIFLDSVNGISTPWGIKYSQIDNKIIFIGNSETGAWIKINTGDIYFRGNVGIGTEAPSYKLQVEGSSYFANTIVGDIISTWHILGGRPSNTTNFNTYFEDSTHLHHDNPARADSEISYNRWFASNSDQTNYSPANLNLPVVDQHVLSFGIDDEGAAWSRHMAFDIRSNAVYVRNRSGEVWGDWEQLVRNTGTWGISITGKAGATSLLNINNRAPIKGGTQLEFQQFPGDNGTGWANHNPTNDWYHHIRMNHGNPNGYFVDLAFCFHAENNFIRRVVGGEDTGWKRLWTQGNAVTSAVWNDYAENRTTAIAHPGQVLYELGDDTLAPTTERLQHFAGIASDTWGFSQGETDTAKTPIAVAGRVLAYTYRNREEYKSGDVLCAAPNGTVDIMTREEIVMYPDRIVGTVSCVPSYEEWGGGEDADRPPVKVNGRIWVKVR